MKRIRPPSLHIPSATKSTPISREANMRLVATVAKSCASEAAKAPASAISAATTLNTAAGISWGSAKMPR